MQFDPALIRRHDVRGPRYTSYPTALQFRTGFDPSHYVKALRRPRAGRGPVPLSMYVHIPFCATVCYYCACNRIVTKDRTRAAAYLDVLLEEMALQAAQLPDDHVFSQLHFGGGTPTYLDDEQFERLFEGLHRHFNLSTAADRDFSIEIDPRTVDPARTDFLVGLGLNRISLGVQDFDPDVQQAVNRLQSQADTLAVMEAARRNGIESVNVDLIYGLPRQNVDGFHRTLESVQRLQPDRIALYSYAHLPERFKVQRQIDASELPDAEAKLQLLTAAVRFLDDAGYAYIGMDHFARPDDSLVRAQRDGTLQRSFQGYTTHGDHDLVGLGNTAISSVGDVYCQNSRDVDDWSEAIRAGRLAIDKGLVLSDEDRLIRRVIQDLMCHFRADFNAIGAQHGLDAVDRFRPQFEALASYMDEGLVGLADGVLTVTERGRFLIRNVAMVFDAYLGPEVRQFSRAI